MHQAECVEFLQWAMPRLGLAWPGFARVHRQVCKRLARRVRELGLGGFDAYRDYVLDHDTEWATIDACCRVTVSRFYRDARVFEHLGRELLPRLAAEAEARGATTLRAWSAGCGAGEEPYSLALVWKFAVTSQFPQLAFAITATDIDEHQLARARTGCYARSALRELPAAWREAAFVRSGPMLCVRAEYRGGIEFLRQDVRAAAPRGPFDLVLCRNLAFTYFDEDQQRQVLAMLRRELVPGGALVIGHRERLPDDAGMNAWAPDLRIYRKPLEVAVAGAA